MPPSHCSICLTKANISKNIFQTSCNIIVHTSCMAFHLLHTSTCPNCDEICNTDEFLTKYNFDSDIVVAFNTHNNTELFEMGKINSTHTYRFEKY